jgi:lysophospholipase L1-like esterase
MILESPIRGQSTGANESRKPMTLNGTVLAVDLPRGCEASPVGRAGATANDGNCDLYVSSDGTHQSTAGHNALGARVARLIAETVLAA